MMRETMFDLIGNIDDRYVREAREYRREQKHTVLKSFSAAACFVLILTAAFLVIPRFFDDREPIPPQTTEALFECAYQYHVSEGRFSAYVGGKVIPEDQIGDKIEDVSVTAGWVDTNRTWSGLETLRGEVYEIIGISSETAAALKFIDQGEAVTTTHYYVILNPAADLSSVEEYRIAPILPNSGGNEMGEIIPE